jgi:hypothetical protein
MRRRDTRQGRVRSFEADAGKSLLEMASGTFIHDWKSGVETETSNVAPFNLRFGGRNCIYKESSARLRLQYSRKREPLTISIPLAA